MSKLRFLVVAASVAIAATAFAHSKEDAAVDYRMGLMTVVGWNFGPLGAMVKGKVPFDAALAQANADLVVTLAKLPWSAFVEGSDKGDTNARPEVWSQPDKFKAAAQRLQDETVKLAAAAKSGNPDAVKTAFSATAQACKSCHDDFRKKH